MSYSPMEHLSLEEMQEIAERDGPTSNAAFALMEAALHDGPVKFYRQRGVFIVDRLEKEE